MDVKTKLMLLKHTDSYWTLFPVAVKKKIFQYKDSQELTEHRERRASRDLCEEIRLYGKLQRKWFIGPIRCKRICTRVCGPMRCRSNGIVCRHECISMRVYGHYWDLNGVNKMLFLHFDLKGAIRQCDIAKEGLWFQMKPDVILRMFGLLSDFGGNSPIFI